MACNLIDDPWLPVGTPNGLGRLSLREALLDSRHVTRLAFPVPTVMVAVLRQTLLPIVLDALGPPVSEAEWRHRFHAEAGFEAVPLERYLDEHRDRFNLFDEGAPFAQAAGLRTPRDERKSASLLVPSAASGNNVPLFGSWTEGDRLSLAWHDAAALLLHCHCWDTAAIKSGAAGDPQVKAGKTTGNPVGSVGRLGTVIPHGRSLFETLMLNVPVSPDGRAAWDAGGEDRPQWRRKPSGPEWEIRSAVGILDLLTWQSRRVRLFPTTQDSGQVVVESVVVTAGDRLLSVPEGEPHTLWTIDEKASPGQLRKRPRRHRAGRSGWRGLAAVVATTDATARTSVLIRQVRDLCAAGALERTFPLGVEVVGVEYGNQSAVVEHIVHDAIPLPVTALASDKAVGGLVRQLGEDADALVKAVDLLEADLRRARGGDLVPWDKGERASVRLVHRLDGPAQRVLTGLQREPEKVEVAAAAWCIAARTATIATAEELLAELPASAFAGREKEERAFRASVAEVRFWARLNETAPAARGEGVDHEMEEVTQ